MRYLLIRAGLAFLSLILISHLALGLARACTLNVAHMPSSVGSFSVSVFSGSAPDIKQVQPSTGLHCQFDADAVAQTTLNGRVPFKRAAYVLTEMSLIGSTVDVTDKPPRRA